MSSRSTNSNKSNSRSRSGSSRSDSLLSLYSADDSMQKKEFKQKHKELKQTEDKLQQLENLVKDSHIISYNADCVRKRSNWSKPDNIFKFDNDDFQPGIMKKSLEQYSPKLHTLLNKIRKLDEKDKKQHGKLFKHFIFSDLKYGNYGAKMLASALIAQGYNIGYTADPKENKSVNKSSKKRVKTAKNKSKKVYGAIRLHSNDVLEKTPNNNFYMLSSSGVYDQNITVKMKKEMLQRFNQRPDNVHGELIRFIILDSGFKEGIDLFDVKYVHIFEPSTYLADQKQVIGRSTRTCGQKGIEFHPIYGWPLHVFIYDLYIPNKITPSMLGAKTAMELYLKSMNLDIRLLNFTSDLEDKTILGSVDYDLNKNVHSFSIPKFSEEEEQESAVREIVHGGAGVDVQQIITLSDIMRSIVSDTSSQRLGHDKMREHIKKYYSEFAWDTVKMENLCAEKGGAKGGNGQIINYTPTQDFIRHYFTPANPVKGMLLYHSVGTGKTCSAIATATANFERAGYTILWVTRTTLKNDIWKNMFDQVCNESIRNQIEYQDLEIPKDSQARMKLLSKAWAIRPMSYKQFSNLILKRNAIYDRLKKLNGAEDPLRKCLLIIDEAHKLYGGDDLSSIEKPDMNALKKAIHYSYQYSGADSVRLLLMTATPITKDPMELIKLVNLCKPAMEQIPDDFDVFSGQYLDDEGNFSSSGKKQYLDDIAGYVSYLNREKDARQFAQPMIEHIETPIVRNIKDVEEFDKKIMRDVLEKGTHELKEKVKQEQKKLEGELGEINKAKFEFLKEECDKLPGSSKKECKVLINDYIKDIIKEAKDYIKGIKENIKEMNKLLKERKKFKNEGLKNIKSNIDKYGANYEKYKTNLIYQLKHKCSKRARNETDLNAHIKDHPDIQKYNEELEGYNKQIDYLGNKLKVLAENYRIRIKQLKDMMKTDLTDIERNVIRMVIRDESKQYKKMQKYTMKQNKEDEKDIKEQMKEVTKLRTTKKKELVKEIKTAIKAEKKQTRTFRGDIKKLRKTMRSTGVKHDVLKDIVSKYTKNMKDDLGWLIKEEEEKERAKQAAKEVKRLEREKAKAEKAAEREAQKLVKQKEKLAVREANKAAKAAERSAIRATKKRMAEEKKAAKKLEKEIERKEKAAARKTKKNKSP